jgi:hypothetical protein
MKRIDKTDPPRVETNPYLLWKKKETERAYLHAQAVREAKKSSRQAAAKRK